DVLGGLQAAQAYTATSLEEPRSSEGSDGATVETELGGDDERFERVEEKIAVTEALPFVSPEDRRLLRLRFVDEMTQTQIAKRLGISQMQVSRRLRSSLERLRTVILVDPEPSEARRRRAPLAASRSSVTYLRANRGRSVVGSTRSIATGGYVIVGTTVMYA